MKIFLPILEALADEYERRHAGRTGRGTRDVQIEFKALTKKAACEEGDRLELAEKQLRALDGQIVQLEYRHPRDKSQIFKVRLPPEKEEAFFAYLGRSSPHQGRDRLAGLFLAAADDANIPEKWRGPWHKFCQTYAKSAAEAAPMQPFSRSDFPTNAELLALLPKLLAWQSESLIRLVSCRLCGSSKRLESLAALESEGEFAGKHRGRIGQILEMITDGQIRTLDDLGILANPRSTLIHGPLSVKLNETTLELGRLQGSFRIALVDIKRADEISTTAQRCLTVENEASFHELAKLQSGELLVHTSYPGSATVTFLKKLRGAAEFWHFGDSDAAGFEILRVLREKTGRDFQPLQMKEGRMPFEQEALGIPQPPWPFYP
jgi:hypothetical protein